MLRSALVPHMRESIHGTTNQLSTKTLHLKLLLVHFSMQVLCQNMQPMFVNFQKLSRKCFDTIWLCTQRVMGFIVFFLLNMEFFNLSRFYMKLNHSKGSRKPPVYPRILMSLTKLYQACTHGHICTEGNSPSLVSTHPKIHPGTLCVVYFFIAKSKKI